LARDYLEGRPLPAALEGLRQRYVSKGEPPPRDVLAAASRNYSTDVATLLFLEALGSRPDARALRERYERALGLVTRLGADRARPEPPPDLLILMVPGWLYVTHGAETNGDFHIQRALYRRWGLAHRLVPVDENGTVESNARIVADAVREASKRHRVFLVSASKSSAETALALGRELEPQETNRVVGWLSIVGVVRGSPLADQALDSALCPLIEAQFALRGFGMEGLRSMRASRLRGELGSLRFPEHLRIFSLVAVPLSGHISDRASSTYGRLRELGPNDGLTLLADELIPGSVPVVLVGTDHYLGPGDQRLWSTALFRVLIADLPRR
jgi:hypothetical protein